MAKLKRKADGRVFDCVVYEHDNGPLMGSVLMVAYYENGRWTDSYLTAFVPAVQGIDY